MTIMDWLGFIGVFQILLAYFLNIARKTSHTSLLFILLNLIGSTMAFLASYLLNYLPFIILEGIWGIISFISLLKYKIKK